MKKVFAKSLLVAAMFSVAGSALAVQKDITCLLYTSASSSNTTVVAIIAFRRYCGSTAQIISTRCV